MKSSEHQQKVLGRLQQGGPLTIGGPAEVATAPKDTLQADLTLLTAVGAIEQKLRRGDTYMQVRAMQQLRVKDVMGLPVAVKETCNVQEALVSMFTHNVGSLIVVGSQQELKGIVSRKDILKASLGKVDLQQVPVSVIMTRMPNIIVATPDDRVTDVAYKLVKHEIDTIPIIETYIEVDGSEVFHVVGRFTKTNATALFVDLGIKISTRERV